MDLILTHNNADFDAVASLLGAHKLHPSAVPVLPERLNYNVAEFITLYQNGLPFVQWEDLKLTQITRLFLVDTQRIPSLDLLTPDTPILIIDHHPPDQDLGENVTFNGETAGAAATLLVEQIRAQHISVNSLEATLLALGIYADTGSLTYGSTTPRDLQAAAWLLEHKAVLDTVQRFLNPPLDDNQRHLFDLLVNVVQTRNIHGYAIMVGAVEVDHYVEQINSVAHRLVDVFDPDALFVIVQMPDYIQMVCRSRHDAVDVGEVAQRFGGGGHSRAAAAKIEGMSLDKVQRLLWEKLEESVEPVTRVMDLMSFGVQTIGVDERVSDVIPRLRRIGHEGYPVVDAGGQIIGLLTRRDADRTMEHGLYETKVGDIMLGGEITLSPQDSVNRLEQVMVASGWGQIPVVDGGKLLGIVTRTDLIKHWAQVHPAAPRMDDHIDPDRVGRVLGDHVARLIDLIAAVARDNRTNLYMVGGVVRDLLLDRPNLDIDFVIEDDAIYFAETLYTLYGGEVSSHRPFGTAKWRLDESVAHALALDPAHLPDHIDFATSRNEFYLHPTALPSVYSGSIKLDLHRRDFTINTLAVQLSPVNAAYRLLDFYGGMSDLHSGLIRVLHSLSFVDDPTRVLRAIRFEQRLGFRIEERTAELMESSRPMLRRITGERIRNEIKLLLKEAEPEQALLVMQERDILSAIHPALHFSQDVAATFQQARKNQADWPIQVEKAERLYWHLLMAHLPPDVLPELGERLLFANAITQSFIDAAQMIQQPGALFDPNAPVSRITRLLDEKTEMALLAAWIIPDGLRRERIERYLTTWRYVQPVTNGYTLQEMGLPTGPRYRVILDSLRDALLDGVIRNEDEENLLLDRLIKETEPDD